MHPIHTLVKLVSLSLILVVSVSAAGGWGKDGHSIVADIAWRELSPAARKEIRALLGDSSLAEVSSWADAVRREDAYRWSAPLHYVNLPIDANEYDHERDCPPEGCAVSAIEYFANVLKDRTNSPQERGEALMFLVHFVGDLHQPLHAGRAEDRGGNSIDVTFLDDPTNLHRVWDTGIMLAASDEAWVERADRLYPLINNANRIEWLASTEESDWQGTAGSWALESHYIAEEKCYIIETGSAIGQEYVQSSITTVEERLSKAGIRLAAVLEDCLGEASAD